MSRSAQLLAADIGAAGKRLQVCARHIAQPGVMEHHVIEDYLEVLLVMHRVREASEESVLRRVNSLGFDTGRLRRWEIVALGETYLEAVYCETGEYVRIYSAPPP